MDVHEFRHGLHEGVAEPLGELVERHNGFPGLRSSGYGESGEWPGVTERGTVNYGARIRPDSCKTVDEDRPEGWEGDNRNGGGEGSGVGDEIVWGK